jgi:hypothetical protein
MSLGLALERRVSFAQAVCVCVCARAHRIESSFVFLVEKVQVGSDYVMHPYMFFFSVKRIKVN